MFTKHCSAKSIVWRSDGRASLRTRPVRSVAILKEKARLEKFPPRFGDAMISHDIEDVQLEYIKSWGTGFDDVHEVPEGYWITDVEGTIPAELKGTYFRNGVGWFDFLDEPVAAPLDANGIIGSVAIRNGKAFFRSRFVKTKESLLEERAGKRLFRGVFGTIPKHGVALWRKLKPRNAGNGKPILTKDKLYIPFEQCALTEIDPQSLETLYPTLPDGLLPTAKRSVNELYRYVANEFGFMWRSVSGDVKYLDPVAETGFGDTIDDLNRHVTIVHSYRFTPAINSSLWRTHVKFFEIGSNLEVHSLQNYAFDKFGMLHSIAVTDNYYIINVSPTTLDPFIASDAEVGFIHSIKWDYTGHNEYHLIPRYPNSHKNVHGNKVRKLKLEDASCLFHFVNAFEEDGNVIIDSMNYPRFPYCEFGKDVEKRDYKMFGFPGAKMQRTVCSVNGAVETRTISDRMVEMPNINPAKTGKRYRYAFMLVGLCPEGKADPTAIGKVDLDTGEMQMWTKGPKYFAGDPTFVPRPGSSEEDDGWVMAFVYNGETEKTEFVILDAKDINKGPLATLYLKDNLGHGTHATWADKYYGPMPVPL